MSRARSDLIPALLALAILVLPGRVSAQQPKPLDGNWEYGGGSGKATIKYIKHDTVRIDATWIPNGDSYRVEARITQQKAESRQLIGTWKMTTAAPDTPCTSKEGGDFYAEFNGNSTAIRVLSPTYDPTGHCGWLRVTFTGVMPVETSLVPQSARPTDAQAGGREGRNLLENGSFEIGPDPGDFITLGGGSTSIPGWIVTRNTIDYKGSHWVSSDGKRDIDLDGTPGFGGIAQTFATIAGRRYRVTFDMAGNPEGPPVIKRLGVQAAGKSAEFDFDVTGKTTSNMGWVKKTWEFTAVAPTTTLEFYSLDTEGGYSGPTLDNVWVNEAAPEFLGTLRRLFTEAQKPTRLWIHPDKPSAVPGQRIALQVLLANSVNSAVVADRNYVALLGVTGGEATVAPGEVTIAKGDTSTNATVWSSNPGQFEVRASSQGLQEAKRPLAYCDSGEIRGLDFNLSQQRAPADGSKIPFTLVFTDGRSHPVTDGHPKNIAFDFRGVGLLQPRNGLVPESQCARDESVLSLEPGLATVKAEAGGLSQERQFQFFLPLTLGLVLLVLCGGAGGAFIRAAFSWPRSRRWSRSRWASFLASGALVGLCLFLAYHYGLLQQHPQFMGGKGVALLLGLVGGYLGHIAMDRIADRLSPGSGGAITD